MMRDDQDAVDYNGQLDHSQRDREKGVCTVQSQPFNNHGHYPQIAEENPVESRHLVKHVFQSPHYRPSKLFE
jgi:hypothetical protein